VNYCVPPQSADRNRVMLVVAARAIEIAVDVAGKIAKRA
jgi:hypothetical protein